MSALGHKRTFRSAIAMSALPPKTDICGAKRNVRFGPKADSCSATKSKPMPDPVRSVAQAIGSGVLLGWLAFEVGGIGKGIGAAIHPHHAGLIRSLRAPGVRRQRWNDDGVVWTNDTAFFAELHPDPAFKHDDGFFHFVHMERHRSARLRPVHEQANPACAEVLVREKSSVDT